MTTIAWDGKTLAADTACSAEDGSGFKTRFAGKLRRLQDGRLAGFAGTVSSGVALLDWLDREDPDTPCPKLKNGSADCLVVNRDGTAVVVESDGVHIPCADPVTAIGSGASLALGALLGGASAVAAVEICIERDPASGFEPVWLTL